MLYVIVYVIVNETTRAHVKNEAPADKCTILCLNNCFSAESIPTYHVVKTSVLHYTSIPLISIDKTYAIIWLQVHFLS